MAITASVRTQVRWQGDRVISKLQNAGAKATVAGGQIYFQAVEKEFKSAPWGSRRAKTGPSISNVPALANLRIRYRHSSPGETPYKQTENMANSIRISSSKRISGSPHLSITRISSRVKYSSSLERGFPQVSIEQHLKRFSKIRLKNPLKLKPGTIIAPRPVWLPIFHKNTAKMKATIARTMITSI